MYDFYTKNYSIDKLKKSRKALKRLYSDIPETIGCLENIASCGAFCCSEQNPQVSFAEFLYSFHYIKEFWSTEDKIVLFKAAVKNYLSELDIKGCMFFDFDKKTCKQHQNRSFNCRTYSQIPDEEFKPRYERLKVLHPHTRNQCNLTKTIGKKPDTNDINSWFNELQFIEKDLGLNVGFHDGDGGSYRTYHDHLLLYTANDSFLYFITKMKKNGSEIDKVKLIESISEKFETYLRIKW